MIITKEDGKIIVREKCFFCENEYQMSAGKYEGKPIKKYGINVCQICFGSNWDGWTGSNESKLIDFLNKNNIPIPERNEKGWLPVEPIE